MRRVMKHSDFSFSQTNVEVCKKKLTELAKLARKNGKGKHHDCLMGITNILSGVQKHFSERNEVGHYDTTIIQLALEHPEIALERISAIAEYCGSTSYKIANILRVSRILGMAPSSDENAGQ